MSGTFLAPIHPLSLPSANHKRYHARSSTVHDPNTTSTAPTSLAHDLLAKRSAAKWLKKQRREFEVNREIKQAKREASKAEEVEILVREREGSSASQWSATEEGKMTAVFAG
jgi:hypothetical protein